MNLVITNNNSIVKIISKYFDIKKCVLEEHIEDINMYVDQELMSKKMELFNKIIIDINSLKNNNQEIIKTISRIKVIYNMQIIIIALGYKVGNELLSELFKIGIYDFVISDDKVFQDEEFRKVIKGNNYIDSLKFKIEDSNKKKQKKIKLNIVKKDKKKTKQVSNEKILACFSIIKNTTFQVFKIIGYVIIMFFISVGATSLFNSNIRELLIEIIKGGV